ncbi:MAG: hypothetical protein ACYC2O_02200 [Microthrixaceae bacterium]
MGEREQHVLRRLVAAVVLLSPFAIPISCAPIDGRSPTIELPSSPAALELGDGTVATAPSVQVLGTVQERPGATTTAPPAPSTTVAPTVPPTPPPTVPPTSPPTTPPVAAPPEPPPSAVPAALAHAVEGVSSDTTRGVAASALGLMIFDWQRALPGWELRFLDGRAGYRGLTYPEERVIEVYVRGSDTPYTLAHVLAHELGHAIDVTWLDDADRRRWGAARGFAAGTPWFIESGGADFASGAGDFAESFAYWQVGPPAWFGELAPAPSVAELAVLVELVLHP